MTPQEVIKGLDNGLLYTYWEDTKVIEARLDHLNERLGPVTFALADATLGNYAVQKALLDEIQARTRAAFPDIAVGDRIEWEESHIGVYGEAVVGGAPRVKLVSIPVHRTGKVKAFGFAAWGPYITTRIDHRNMITNSDNVRKIAPKEG